MKMLCPYCDVEISMSSVDAEDGYCPECGTAISATSIFDNVEDLELDDDFEEELDDDF